MNTALEYSTRVVQEGGRRCKKSTLLRFSTPDPSKNTFNEPAMCIQLIQIRHGLCSCPEQSSKDRFIELWITVPTCKFRGPECFRLKDPIKETQSDVYGIGRSVFSTTPGSG
jgi:hypothetical protein